MLLNLREKKLVPSIYAYFDYRKWLGDAQGEIKKIKKYFTLDYIANSLGLKSKGHITQIIQGKKNIPLRSVEKYAEVFSLDERETRYLITMIQFDLAKTHETKKLHLDKMVYLRSKGKKTLQPQQFELCRKWYYVVMREMVKLLPIKDATAELGKKFTPALTKDQCAEALEFLEKIKLIYRDSQGFFQQANAVISFGEEWQSLAVREFQKHTFHLAQGAIAAVPPEKREISTVTMTLSEEGFAKLKEQMQQFRREVLNLVENDSKPTKVFQMNLSLFPLSGDLH